MNILKCVILIEETLDHSMILLNLMIDIIIFFTS